jgi:uncharacterized membrane protein YgcG
MSEQLHSEYERVLTECLDAIIEGRRSAAQCLAAYPAYATEMAPSLRMAENLRGATVIRPSLGFRKQAASRLQQRIATSSRPARRKPARSAQRRQSFLPGLAFRLGAALMIVALLAGFTGAAAYAADGAVPGDRLYGVDTAVEQIELSFTLNADKALALQLRIATERLGEAESLLDAGDTTHAAEALDAYNVTVAEITISSEQISSQDDTNTAGAIQDTLSQHQIRLQALLSKVPEQARPGIERAIEASKHGQEQANKHRPNKDDKGTPPGQDDGSDPAVDTETGNSSAAGEDSGTSSADPGTGSAGITGNGSENGQSNSTGTTGTGNGQGNGNGNGNSNGSSDNGPGGKNGNGQGAGEKDKDKEKNDSGTPAAIP